MQALLAQLRQEHDDVQRQHNEAQSSTADLNAELTKVRADMRRQLDDQQNEFKQLELELFSEQDKRVSCCIVCP